MRPHTTRAPRLEALEARALLTTLVESEPNNRPAMADMAAFADATDTLTLTGQARSGRDADFFRVTAPTTGTYRISVEDSGNLRAAVDVRGASGGPLFQTRPGRGLMEGTFEARAGQELMVRVRGLGRGAGRYEIDLSAVTPTIVTTPPVVIRPPLPIDGRPPGGGDNDTPGAEPSNTMNEAEPNDSTSTANPFDLGADGFIQLAGALASGSDQDHFVFTPSRGGRLNLDVRHEGDAVKLDVLDGSGQSRLTIYSDRPSFLSFVDVDAGSTYFVRLTSVNGGASTYRADVALSSA